MTCLPVMEQHLLTGLRRAQVIVTIAAARGLAGQWDNDENEEIRHVRDKDSTLLM